MWLEVTAVALIVLQTVTIVLLWLQGRPGKPAGVSSKSNGGVPELLIVNALNRIDHRLSLLEERGRDDTEAGTPRRSTEVPATQIPAWRMSSAHFAGNHYELAQQLAREGADLEQLMTRCGLSRNEAELVQRLYAKRA